MMSAVQPYISMGISKTVNLPASATIEEMCDLYLAAWKMKLKSVALYRDTSKIYQPLNNKAKEKNVTSLKPTRKRLADDIQTIRHKFDIAGHKGYLHIGMFEDGSPGEMFIRMSHVGSTINGLMDCFGIAISLGLQYGVPLSAFVSKFEHAMFEPTGWTKNQDIRFAKSIVSYVFKWMNHQFGGKSLDTQPVLAPSPVNEESLNEEDDSIPTNEDMIKMEIKGDGPLCSNCGSLTIRSGSCHKCPNCGTQTGCS
jgi:ribonucleoside-diphosphate reductase alpha chain